MRARSMLACMHACMHVWVYADASKVCGKTAAVVPLICCRGVCIPLWTVLPPLQVVLSSACSVASLSRFPSHYLPGHPHLREGALAAYLFG